MHTVGIIHRLPVGGYYLWEGDALSRYAYYLWEGDALSRYARSITNFRTNFYTEVHFTIYFHLLLPTLDPLPALKDAERLLIEEVLRRSDGNQGIAAQLLGMSRQALNNRLRRSRPSPAERTLQAGGPNGEF